MRKATGLLLAAALGLMAGNANAQNLDLDEVGSLLALPVITGDHSNESATYVTITNAGDAVNLHINVISGDEDEYWKAQDFTCPMTASETALFFFMPDASGEGSLLSFECATAGGGLELSNSPLITRNGMMVVALEDPATGETVNTNQIFGDAVVMDYSAGSAYSVNAIPFQGVLPGGGTADRKYRFDNVEYSEFPSALATNFIAPGGGYEAGLILFTLDGTVGSFQPPEAALSIKFYNDDEVVFSTSHHFDCFDIVNLLDIDSRFHYNALGSEAGHMVLTPELVTYANLAHDSQFDGDGGILGVRIPPVHGWLFQTVANGSAEPKGDYVVSGAAAWGRTLSQSQLPVVTSAGDVPVLNAP